MSLTLPVDLHRQDVRKCDFDSKNNLMLLRFHSQNLAKIGFSRYLLVALTNMKRYYDVPKNSFMYLDTFLMPKISKFYYVRFKGYKSEGLGKF